MSDNNIEVKFGAQTSGLKEGSAQAAAALEQAIGRMEKAFSSMAKGMQNSTQAVNKSLNDIKEESSRAANAVEGTAGVIGRFASVAAIAAVGKAFIDMADNVTLADARLKLAVKSSEDFKTAQAEIYRIAQANNIGLMEATALYTKLHPAVTRLGGGVQETGAITDAFAMSMRISGASAQEAAAATLQFGQALGSGKLQGDEFRTMTEAAPRLLQALSDGMGVPIEKLKQMGSEGKLTSDVIGNALIKQVDALRNETSGLPDTVGGAFTRMKNDVLGLVGAYDTANKSTSTLARFIDILSGYIRALTDIFKDTAAEADGTSGKLDYMGAIGRALGVVIETVIIIFANLKFMVTAIAKDFITFGLIVEAVAKGKFSDIPKIFNEAAEEAKNSRAELDAFEKRVLGLSDSVNQAKKDMKGDGTEGEDSPKTYKPLKSQVPPEDKNALAKYENELERMKLAHDKMNKENGTFYEFSRQREAEFWESKLKGASLTEEQRLQVEKKALSKRLEINKAEFEANLADFKVQMDAYRSNMDAKIAIATQASEVIKQKYGEESKEFKLASAQIVQLERQKREQLKQVAEEERTQSESAQLFAIEQRARLAQIEVDQGITTAAQAIENERKFEEERIAIKRAALGERLLLAQLDPDKNIVEIEKINSAIQQLEQDHQAKMTEIKAKSTIEQGKYSKQFFDGMESGMTGVLQQFMKGTMTLTNLVRGMAGAILDAFTNMLAKYVVQQIMSSTLVTQAKTAEAGTVVAANAAEAGSGAAASQASIPYVGPAMAAAAFAATIGLVMGAKKLFSASKGFDVPAGVNPVTQLHESEMVLPKEQADVIRGMSNGNGGGGAVNVNISAVDAKSVRDLFMREGAALADSIQKQARAFKMTGNTVKGGAR